MTWEGRVRFEISPDDPDSAAPTWIDFTPRVRDVVQSIDATIGRQDDLEQVEPATFTLVLDNSDDALTYGNTLSVYASWWGPGRKCRLRDTVAGQVIDIATGYLQTPTERLDTVGIEHRVVLSIVDRLARLAGAEPFVSTLGALIRSSPYLVAYWSMADSLGAVAASSLVPGVGPLLQVTNYNDAPAYNQIAWGERQGPPGDDGVYLQLDPTDAVIAANYLGSSRLARRDLSITLAAATVLAFQVWVYIPVDVTRPSGPGQIMFMHANGFANPFLTVRADIGAAGWSFIYGDSAHAPVTVSVPAVKTDAWSLVGLFLDVDAATMTLRVDGQSATGSLGAGALTGTFQELAFDGLTGQSIGNMQAYIGPPAQLGQAFFDAQFQMGFLGLDRQHTGDRIRTIAGYAGIPAGELTHLDTGCALMQPARLAGQTPLDAMRDAERTEQGLLYVDGSGNLTFKDRHTLYNI